MGRIVVLLVGLLVASFAQAQLISHRASASASTSGLVFVGAGALATDSGACNQVVSPAIPAGTVGDLLVATVISRDGGTLTQSGAAWNTLFSDNQANHRARIYWRIATGTDTLTVTKTVTCTDVIIGAMARFGGVDTTTPFMGGGTTVSQFQNSVNVGSAAGTINATVQNSMALFAALVSDDNVVNTPAGFNSAFSLSTTTGNDARLALFYKNETTTGNKGPYTTTQAAADNNHGVLALIRPAAADLSISMPVGTVNGDVMIASIAVRPCSITSGGACNVTVTPPAGWTQIGFVDQTTGGINASFGSRLFTYYRVASGDTGPYTWTFGGNPEHAGAAGGISSYENVDNTSPIVDSGGAATASAATHAAPSVDNGNVTNTMIVTAHSVNSSGALAPAAGMTERLEVDSLTANNVSGLTLAMSEEPRTVLGATGTRTSTFSGPTTDTGATFTMTLRPSANVGFDIEHGDFTVRCAVSPMRVTIIARDKNGNVATGYTGLVNISTSTGNGDWSVVAANGTLVNIPAGDGAATYTFNALDQGMIVLNLSNTNAVTLTVTVQDSSTSFAGISTNTISFITQGYVFIPDPLQIAGKPQSWTVEQRLAPGCAISTNNGHGAANAVKMWLTLDGVHPGAAALPTATGTGGAVALPTAEPGANNINLDFSGPGALVAGQAPFTLTTTDVGKYIINLRDTATAIRGTSGPVTVRPFALGFPGVTHGSSPASAVLAAAGDNFSATVTAYQWALADDAAVSDGVPDAGANVTNNTVATNFAWPVTVAPITNHPGTALGAVARGVACDLAGSIAQGAFAAGTATVTDWCYSEAGNVQLGATASNYLNTPGVNVTGHSGLDGTGTGVAGYVGRFRPKNFALSAGALTHRSASSCAPASNFTYMDEALGLAFTLTARNTQGATTQNYNGTYAQVALGTFSNLGMVAMEGTTVHTARIDSGSTSSGTWTNGAASVSVSTTFRRNTPDAPDGPYTVAYGIAPVNTDNVPMSAYDMDAVAPPGNEHTSLGVSVPVRFGRLRLLGAVGSENIALSLPTQAQYWDGSKFALNADDSCTVLDRQNIALTFAGTTLVSCETSVNAATVPFVNGVGSLTLAAPGAGNIGSVIVTPQLSGNAGNYCNGVGVLYPAVTSANRAYLLGAWSSADPDSNANTTYDDNPSVRAAFGVYGAQPRSVIFMRENY